jgi:hypothetical protein
MTLLILTLFVVTLSLTATIQRVFKLDNKMNQSESITFLPMTNTTLQQIISVKALDWHNCIIYRMTYEGHTYLINTMGGICKVD